MTVRALDKNGDIITSGQQFITSIDEIAQTIVTRVKLFRGEYFRNIDEGTPWFQEILGKNISTSRANAAIRTRIAQTKGVIKLLSFSAELSPHDRTYSIRVSVLTEYGNINDLKIESVV